MILSQTVPDGCIDGKIQAVLRRAYTFGVSSPEVLAHKGVTLNLDSQILAFGDQNWNSERMNSGFCGRFWNIRGRS